MGKTGCGGAKKNMESARFIHKKISFGGIPNSCNVFFLQIFLKRADLSEACCVAKRWKPC
jgi:hypothetical protein